MIILGLHFGHDSSVTVIQDGEIIVSLIVERHKRVKHSISFHPSLVLKAIEAANIKIDQIDYCAITSTQYYEIILLDANILDISLNYLPEHKLNSTIAEQIERLEINADEAFGEIILSKVFCQDYRQNHELYNYPYISGKPKHEFKEAFPYCNGKARSDFKVIKWLNHYTMQKEWLYNYLTFEKIKNIRFDSFVNTNKTKHGFHYPVTVTLLGRTIPSYFINHHASHAAATYFQSDYNDAAILTHDGLHKEQSGMFWLGLDEQIFPLTPHFMEIGMLYRCASMSLSLGWTDGPGKMMGLAPYGKSKFFSEYFVGNYFDYLPFRKKTQVLDWLNHCLFQATELGYDISQLGQKDSATAAINADIAASTQKLCEETILKACKTLRKMVNNLGINTPNICMSGGVMLNCPSNTQVWEKSGFSHVFVEPACDDSGLSTGAALWLYHNLLNGKRLNKKNSNNSKISPYLGQPIKEKYILNALEYFADNIVYSIVNNPAKMAAFDISKNKIIGWFEGRSEVGPRALGHRSILANPRYKENLNRVNCIKKREKWRPLAPSVLASETSFWFGQVPFPSPYMLFTAQVISPDIPAVTHVNNTARIQTVDETCGEFYKLLVYLKEINDCPVVLNTSLNGRGEPIVETPFDAIEFFLNSDLDALYLNDYHITKKDRCI